MSSNTSLGQGIKGSKLMMQIVASQCNPFIESIFGDTITWLSPKLEESYKEYQLNNQRIRSRLGIRKDDKKVFNFWPTRQPQWDGLALGKSGILYLFEAKSHLSETYSSLHSTSEYGRTLITKSIRGIASKVYGVTNRTAKKNYWLKGNYQIANRLTFLQKMKENASVATEYEQVKLVFLNFMNDYTIDDKLRVKDAETWDKHYDKIFKSMGISREQVKSEGVIFINYPAPSKK